MVDHRLGDAAEQERLHAAQAAGAHHDEVGFHLGRGGEDRVRHISVAALAARVRDEPGGHRALGALGRPGERRRADRCVDALGLGVGPGEPDAHPQSRPERAAAHQRIHDRLPDGQHRRLRAGHELCHVVDRRLCISGPVVGHQDHRRLLVVIA